MRFSRNSGRPDSKGQATGPALEVVRGAGSAAVDRLMGDPAGVRPVDIEVERDVEGHCLDLRDGPVVRRTLFGGSLELSDDVHHFADPFCQGGVSCLTAHIWGNVSAGQLTVRSSCHAKTAWRCAAAKYCLRTQKKGAAVQRRPFRDLPGRQMSLPMATAVSNIRLEKPHSLSYHVRIRHIVPSMTLV